MLNLLPGNAENRGSYTLEDATGTAGEADEVAAIGR